MRAHEDPKKGRKLQALADELVAAGLERDVTALKEIGDRLDGKPSQAMTVEVSANERLLQLIESGMARARSSGRAGT